MKRVVLLLLAAAFLFQLQAYDKKSLVERFTNCSCGPCATLNNSWYNATTASLVNSGDINHIIYNVDWPSPTDPMHLLNAIDNNSRRGFYGVNSVPWVEINGATFNTSSGSGGFTTTVNNGNMEYSPFQIELYPEVFSNDVINVNVIIKRDPSDATVFTEPMLRVALVEKWVPRTCISCCNNGETEFFSVCRKVLPSGNGMMIEIPAPGDSVIYDLMYIPTSEFLAEVDFDSLKVVAFIQDEQTQEMYQSVSYDHLIISDNINAAFSVEENLGVLPFEATFQDYSTATSTTTLSSWEWDFDNDGTIDSYDQNPVFTYQNTGTFTVSLTVSDGVNQHTRMLEDFITVINVSSDILVVNGIDYGTASYQAEMTAFYNSSACFGNHQVDVWDLFGDNGFDYSTNPDINEIHLFNRSIPTDVLLHYQKVIWIGNNFSGDIAFYDPQQVLDYTGEGGNFLLATRLGSEFFNADLRSYCGVTSFTGDQTITSIVALDNNLVDMTAGSGHSLVHFAYLDSTSEATPLFDDSTPNTGFIAGFTIDKQDEGVFIYIAGRPYRYDNATSFTNYDYIIDNFMTSSITSVNDQISRAVPDNFELLQNYPNPFNPSTKIRYQIPEAGLVTLKVYDVLGNEIKTLVSNNKAPGTYEAELDASELSSGIYIYKLTSGDFISSKKMVLMK